MIRIIEILITGTLCSFYLFPFSFTFFPIGNTKIYLAVLGLLLFIYNKICNKRASIPHSMLIISLAALGVSIASLLSIFYNSTSDTAYVMYIVSMWVWASAAYFITQCIKIVHGKITFELICYYMIGVCAIQCVFALMNEFLPTFKGIVDAYIEQETANLNRLKRMYGIGASLDTAGSRFACALIIISYLLSREKNNSAIFILSLSFIFISITGNMIARTTSAGLAIAIIYYIYTLKNGFNTNHKKILLNFGSILTIFIPSLILLYSVSPEIHKMLRFAFESFFNLVENGSFETSSTNELQIMWQQTPQTVKTWIIGDGYFMSPYHSDPYYIGTIKRNWAFYMGTDVGYWRFIFYFGLIGLIVFTGFFLCCVNECAKKYQDKKVFFFLLFIMNMLLWAKVSTDVFFIFAPFVMAELSNTENIVKS